jgi:hypothetical protein
MAAFSVSGSGMRTTVRSRVPRLAFRSDPENGHAALPDFERLAKLTARGATIKKVWRDYANTTPKPYSYEYFSTLFRVWARRE